MIPPEILLQLIPNAIQLGTSLYQGSQAKKLEDKLGTLDYKIPNAATEVVDRTRVMANPRRFAGQTGAENQIMAQTGATTSDILKSSTSGADALAALTGVDANTKSATNDLNIYAEQDYQRRQQQLNDALTMYAGFQDKEWQIDEYDPYMRSVGAISSYRNGMLNNFYQSFKGGANAIAGNYMHEQNMKLQRELAGGVKSADGSAPNSNTPKSNTSYVPAATPTPIYNEYGADEVGYIPDELYLD